jgi:octaprenyl-diphosphate synthase
MTDYPGKFKKSLGHHWIEFDSFFRYAIHSEIMLLNTINQYLLEHLGKQLRPLLALMAADMCGTINQSTYLAASAVEMIHTASLLHDDVVDNADQRRGAPSVKAIWKSNASVLTGDYWLARIFQLLIRYKEERLLPGYSTCLIDLSEGELLQLEKTQSLNITEEDYFKIIGKKTASLMAASMSSGSITAGADEVTVQKMHDIGYALGMAFQIRDDIFDYNKTNFIGKPAGNDLREQKITLPLLHALSIVDENARAEILNWVKKSAKSRRYISRIIRFTKEQKGMEYANTILHQYIHQGIDILHSFPESKSRKNLIRLANYLAVRKN